jgi:hypothetical protein
MLACMEPELQMQFETNHDRSASGHVPDIGQD